MRENTDAPSTVEVGTNELVGPDPLGRWRLARKVLAGRAKQAAFRSFGTPGRRSGWRRSWSDSVAAGNRKRRPGMRRKGRRRLARLRRLASAVVLVAAAEGGLATTLERVIRARVLRG